MEQLSKFSRIVWISMLAILLLCIYSTFSSNHYTVYLSYCLPIITFVILGGWFVILYRNSNRRSPLHAPAILGIIATAVAVICKIVQALDNFLPSGLTGNGPNELLFIVLFNDITFNNLTYYVFMALLTATFIFIGLKVPAGKYRRAAYGVALVLITSQIFYGNMTSISAENIDNWLKNIGYIHLAINTLELTAYALFAYTIDTKNNLYKKIKS